MKMNNMYAETKTWNPFVGCSFDCIYCIPSFQRQLKRQKHNCELCYMYIPHKHPERLNRIPSAKIIFVVGTGDISFAPPEYTRKIIQAIKAHNKRTNNSKTFYFQSKTPKYFEQFLDEFPENVILLTTLETNRDKFLYPNNTEIDYSYISKAPVPSVRYADFLALKWPKKVVTIEPILEFDMDVFSQWIKNINPLYVWIGYNTAYKSVKLPEPPIEKTKELIYRIREYGIPVKTKYIPEE